MLEYLVNKNRNTILKLEYKREILNDRQEKGG